MSLQTLGRDANFPEILLNLLGDRDDDSARENAFLSSPACTRE